MTSDLAARNKDLVRRLYADVDAGSLTIVDDYYAADYLDHAPAGLRPTTGVAELKETFAALRRAFPDTRHTIEDLVAEADRVVARVSARGTHTGELWGRPPTGRLVTLTSIVIYRVVGGRIAERWSEHGAGVLEQLGMARPS